MDAQILRDDPDKGAIVEGLLEEIVPTRERVMETVKRGEANRHYGSTAINAGSSRSHTIFRMVIESQAREEGGGDALEGENEGGWHTITSGGKRPDDGSIVKVCVCMRGYSALTGTHACFTHARAGVIPQPR